MAKRSPILGYNHNVRYRGLIFHVQTEDSGVMSPHLFTHMFYGGVIVSTRKLVYDAGSAEESIKSLMQAQHKAVLKDLKRGMFDDKIDEYLGGTEGLLPRGVAEEPEDRPSEPSITIEPDSEPQITLPSEALALDITQPTPVIREEVVLTPAPTLRTAVPPPIPVGKRPSGPIPEFAHPTDVMPAVKRPSEPHATPRTITVERKSAPTAVRSMLPPEPSSDLDPPTELDPMSSVLSASLASVPLELGFDDDVPSAPDIEILQLELDADESPPNGRRRAHDTEVSMATASAVAIDEPRSDGIPNARVRTPASVPPIPAISEKRTGDRSAVGAASLPPVRPLARPALTSPTAMSRPLTPLPEREEAHGANEPPPGSLERPGAYAKHSRRPSRPHTIPQEIPSARDRKDSSSNTAIPIIRDRERKDSSSSTPIPAGLGRPRPMGPPSTPPTGPVPRPIKPEPTPGARYDGIPQAIKPAQTVPMRSPIPVPGPPRPTPGSAPLRSPNQSETPRARTPTPSRTSVPRTPNPSSGVVMTRPAVIVGAPSKQTAPRVRKAREEEGRGFGQGLISEKSLDEVILAYLSEDADDK